MVWVRRCVKLLRFSEDSSFQGLFVRQSNWGLLVFRVCMCVKLLGDSTFKGLPVRHAIAWGTLLLLVLVIVVQLLLLLLLLLVPIPLKHAPSFRDSGSTYILSTPA